MRHNIFPVLATVVTACGGPHTSEDGSRRHPHESGRVEYLVEADVGGVVESADQKFWFEIPAFALDIDAIVTIERLASSPLPEATLSNVYSATLDPADALSSGIIEGVFLLDESVAQSAITDDLKIAWRESGSGPFELAYSTSYDAESRELRAYLDAFGDFAVIDLGDVDTCSCDVSSACDASCGACDPDCEEITECTATQWTCSSGECIPGSYECDVYVDCDDGSDEDEHCDGEVEPSTGDAYEPDGSFATAKLIAPSETQSRSLHVAGDHDYVRFSLSETREVTLETAGASSGDTVLYLYDDAGAQLAYDDESGAGSFSRLSRTLVAGDYYALVRNYYSSSTLSSYTLELTVAAPVLTAPSGVVASVAAGVITVSWSPAAAASAYLVFYDTDSGYAPFAPDVTASEGAPGIVTTATSQTLSGLPGGRTYYIAVTALADGEESGYSWPVSATLPPSADPYEPDNDFAAARPIEAGEVQTHSLHVAGDADFVVLTLSAAQDIALETDGPSGDTVLFLYDANHTQIGYDDESGVGSFSKIVRSGLPAGTYFAKVANYYSGSTLGTYTLRLSTGAPVSTPTGVSAAGGQGSITVSWNPVPGATGYEVYFDNDSSVTYYPDVVAAEGSSPLAVADTTVTLTGLTAGTTYYAGVMATNGVNKSPLSAVVSATAQASVDAFEADDEFATAKAIAPNSNQAHSIHASADRDYVTFTLAAGARITLETAGAAGDTVLHLYDADLVEIANDDDSGVGTFSRLVALDLPAGTYYAMVEAKAATVINTYSLALTLAPKDLVAAAAAGSVTLSWSAVSGATGYAVYYDDDADNPPYSPTSLALEGASPVSVTGTTLTLTGLPAGQTYYFAITATTGELESTYSAQAVATPE